MAALHAQYAKIHRDFLQLYAAYMQVAHQNRLLVKRGMELEEQIKDKKQVRGEFILFVCCLEGVGCAFCVRACLLCRVPFVSRPHATPYPLPTSLLTVYGYSNAYLSVPSLTPNESRCHSATPYPLARTFQSRPIIVFKTRICVALPPTPN